MSWVQVFVEFTIIAKSYSILVKQFLGVQKTQFFMSKIFAQFLMLIFAKKKVSQCKTLIEFICNFSWSHTMTLLIFSKLNFLKVIEKYLKSDNSSSIIKRHKLNKTKNT